MLFCNVVLDGRVSVGKRVRIRIRVFIWVVVLKGKMLRVAISPCPFFLIKKGEKIKAVFIF